MTDTGRRLPLRCPVPAPAAGPRCPPSLGHRSAPSGRFPSPRRAAGPRLPWGRPAALLLPSEVPRSPDRAAAPSAPGPAVRRPAHPFPTIARPERSPAVLPPRPDSRSFGDPCRKGRGPAAPRRRSCPADRTGLPRRPPRPAARNPPSRPPRSGGAGRSPPDLCPPASLPLLPADTAPLRPPPSTGRSPVPWPPWHARPGPEFPPRQRKGSPPGCPRRPCAPIAAFPPRPFPQTGRTTALLRRTPRRRTGSAACIAPRPPPPSAEPPAARPARRLRRKPPTGRRCNPPPHKKCPRPRLKSSGASSKAATAYRAFASFRFPPLDHFISFIISYIYIIAIIVPHINGPRRKKVAE